VYVDKMVEGGKVKEVNEDVKKLVRLASEIVKYSNCNTEHRKAWDSDKADFFALYRKLKI
jgi:hypothetical protein